MLYFIRHGETDYNKQGLWMGSTDISLNATGLAQALKAAQDLTKLSIDIIYASPLQRAYKTAQMIASYQTISPQIISLDALKERNYGILEGQQKTLSLEDDLQAITGVEPKQHLIARLNKALQEITATPYHNALIVSHGGVFHCLTHDMFYHSVPDATKFSKGIGNCQLVKLLSSQ